MINVGIKGYLWSRKSEDQQAARTAWQLSGGTYLGYRSFLQQVKEDGFLGAWRGEEEESGLGSEHSWSAVSTAQTAIEESGSSGAPPPPRPSAAPPLAFWHSFDAVRCSVRCLRFGRLSTSLLAWGASDGTVALAETGSGSSPPRLLHLLRGHSRGVRDLDWSGDNAFLLSCGDDGAACLWHATQGRLCRRVEGAALGNAAVAAARFHPVNHNLVLLATAAAELVVVNASTGRAMARATLPGPAAALEVSLDAAFVLDRAGGCHAFSTLLGADGALQLGLAARLLPAASTPAPRGFRPPLLGASFVSRCAAAGDCSALALADAEGRVWLCAAPRGPAGKLQLRRAVQLGAGEGYAQKAALGPGRPGAWARAPGEDELAGVGSGGSSRDGPSALANEAGACAPRATSVLALGCVDERDGTCYVALADVAPDQAAGRGWFGGGARAPAPAAPLARLSAHAAPVVACAWAWDESALASADAQGVVVLWREPEAGEPDAAAALRRASRAARKDSGGERLALSVA